MRTYSQALSCQRANMVLAEHPEGDPFGGPAAGQREKSKGLGVVVGVVAGLATAGAGWGMMMANSATTLSSLAGGAMFAGGISTALGAVTGNKKLSKIGGILSLAGGVGSLAADVAAAGSLTGAEFGKTAADGWATTMNKLEGAFGSVLGSGQPAATSTISQGGIAGTPGMTTGGTSPGLLAGEFGATAPATTGIGSTSMVGDLAGGAQLTIGGNTLGSTSLSTTAGGTAAGGGAGVAGGAAGGAAQKGILGKAMDFAQTPAGMNLVGNTLQGMAAGSAKQNELDLLALKYKDSRADLERELANLNFRYEVIDPNDPQAEQKRRAAQAAGVPTITLGVNPNAGPVTPVGYASQPNQLKVA